MSFTDYTQDLQVIMLNNYEYFTKWLVFLVLIFLSSYYIFVVWKKQEKTKFLTVVLLRLFLVLVSFGYLITSPINLLLMSPEYSFYDFYNLPLKFYVIIMSIALFVLFIDLVRYGVLGLLKLGGLDFGDNNTAELIRQIQNNKHFYKFKGGRK